MPTSSSPERPQRRSRSMLFSGFGEMRSPYICVIRLIWSTVAPVVWTVITCSLCWLVTLGHAFGLQISQFAGDKVPLEGRCVFTISSERGVFGEAVSRATVARLGLLPDLVISIFCSRPALAAHLLTASPPASTCLIAAPCCHFVAKLSQNPVLRLLGRGGSSGFIASGLEKR